MIEQQDRQTCKSWESFTVSLKIEGVAKDLLVRLATAPQAAAGRRSLGSDLDRNPLLSQSFTLHCLDCPNASRSDFKHLGQLFR